MNIEYRKLGSHESKLYRAIRLESLEQFPDSFEASYEESVKTEKLRMETDIENQTPEKFVIGAFADQKLIGLCAFVIDNNNVGNIYQMYIKKEFQGKNIGSGLLQSIIHEAKKRFNIDEILLEVAPDNHSAHFLYQKNGFKEICHENEVNEPSKVILMKYSV